MREALIDRARRGDRQAFADLAAGEIDRLHAIARLTLRDSGLAEDAVQEALVRCWRRFRTLRDPDRFDAWLRRILMRAIADEFGRRRRFEGNVQFVGREPDSVGPEAHVADRDQLERAFRRLSIDHRSIVVLHHYADVSLADAAAALGIPGGTAKSRYRHAMAALRAALEADARLAGREEARA